MPSDPKGSTRRSAPGPKGHWLLGHVPEFRRDVLQLLTCSARTYGDVVRFRLGPRVIHLLNHPDYVEHVLVKNHRNYDKSTRSANSIAAVTGPSLLVSNGEAWHQQRRVLQPIFHPQNIARFAEPIALSTAAMLARWQEHGPSTGSLDVASEIMRLTYTIVGRTLFSADVGSDADAIQRAMEVILPQTFARLGRLFNWPHWVPTPENRRFWASLRAIDSVVYRLIAQHRVVPTDRDLLALLMSARDDATGLGLSDRQLRDQAVTFLLAGHETTANALTWTFYLLSRHPDVARQLVLELEQALEGRAPTIEMLPRLGLLRRVLQESMRLYPPIWIMERRVIQDDMVGGFRLPAGSSVVVSPFSLHRHPAFWDAPDEFQPDRFLRPGTRAYLPFGAGPRACIGSEFALLEAQLILSMVLQKFELRLVSEHPVEPFPGITLRTRDGMHMTLHPR